jgi:phosphogluconate dehydratase
MALLGICDKIVPGLLIGALRFGHLPTIFVPAGPMPSGLANKEKQRIRQLYAEGKVGRAELLEAKRQLSRRRHLHLLWHRQFQPDDDGGDGPAHAGRGLRQSGHAAAPALTRAAVHRLAGDRRDGDDYRPMGARASTKRRSSTRCVGLLATGGSTNHAIHMPAMARAAGIMLDWEDIDELSPRCR